MKTLNARPILPCQLIVVFVLSACQQQAAAEPTAVPNTDTPAPTATDMATSTNTPRPSPTPRPTQTPNLAATQKYEGYNAEIQRYFDLGYLTSTEGKFRDIDDFEYEWAQLYWYRWFLLSDTASDLVFNAHFQWESAYQNADTSGCGVVFALQNNDDHYAVFLDRSEVLFLIGNGTGIRKLGKTRGSGKVKFGNPAEADFVLIVKENYAYVLVDDEVIGEYTLSQSQPVRGQLALTVLSGTNKDYGTRCEMTDIHLFIPD